MMLGIGVDDMFVICNAIDQQPYHLPQRERIRKGMMHAGPSVTITSLTDCVAFFIGARSSIVAIQAFCVFAGVTVIMLYLTQVTIFLCFVVWDSRRVSCRFHECCYLCFCKEDSVIFCKGKFMTPNQRAFFEMGKRKQDASEHEKSTNAEKNEKPVDDVTNQNAVSSD